MPLQERNRLFLKNGHDCSLIQQSYGTIGKKIINLAAFWTKIRVVSEVNLLSNYYLKSQGALRKEKLRQFKHSQIIIHPLSDFRKYWEAIMLLVIYIDLFLIPLDFGYFRATEKGEFVKSISWGIVRFILDIFLFMDLLLNFITGYFDKQNKKVVLSPLKIIKHYLLHGFLYHLVLSIPTRWDLIFNISHTVNNALYILALVKIFRLSIFFKYWKRTMMNYNVEFCYHASMNIILCIALYYHWICCIILYRPIALPKLKVANRMQFNANDTSYFELYTKDFYESSLIISNSGFGFMRPKSNYTLSVIVFSLFLSKYILICTLARIVEIVNSLTSSKSKYMEMVRELQEYMKYKRLPEYFQNHILTYYEFRFEKRFFHETEIFGVITEHLRQEITMHCCRKLVENVVFFKDIPGNLMIRLVSRMRSEVYLANDVIIKAKTRGDSMYFIASGTVAVYTASGCEICHLEDGAHFGEIALITADNKRIASVIAVEVCELYRLDRSDFIKAVHPYPDLLDKIEKIAVDRAERTNILDEYVRREMAARSLY